jgi:hypothetical protein
MPSRAYRFPGPFWHVLAQCAFHSGSLWRSRVGPGGFGGLPLISTHVSMRAWSHAGLPPLIDRGARCGAVRRRRMIDPPEGANLPGQLQSSDRCISRVPKSRIGSSTRAAWSSRDGRGQGRAPQREVSDAELPTSRVQTRAVSAALGSGKRPPRRRLISTARPKALVSIGVEAWKRRKRNR